MFKREKLSGNCAGVLGFGKSGRAVATLLAKNGFDVLISEDAPMAHFCASQRGERGNRRALIRPLSM